MGKMGEELQRARVERALAEEMAAREDPHTVTVADVTARAGVSHRAFYELYANKEACFQAAFEAGLALAAEEMYAAYARQARWHDGVRAALAELLGLLDREPALARLCIVYALGGGRPVLQRRMQAIELLCEFVDRGRLDAHGRVQPPEVAAEGVVGAVLAVLHTRLVASAGVKRPQPLSELLGPLMNLILLPYMGAAKAGRELTRPTPATSGIGLGLPGVHGASAAPETPGAPETSEAPGVPGVFGQSRPGMRVTYRTARVLRAIGERPGASNRQVAEQAGIVDQGQISRLLSRLESLGLVVNQGVGAGGSATRGTANAWVLTARGEHMRRGVQPQARPASRPARR
jgi:AcrR family transcriptional regulator